MRGLKARANTPTCLCPLRHAQGVPPLPQGEAQSCNCKRTIPQSPSVTAPFTQRSHWFVQTSIESHILEVNYNSNLQYSLEVRSIRLLCVKGAVSRMADWGIVLNAKQLQKGFALTAERAESRGHPNLPLPSHLLPQWEPQYVNAKQRTPTPTKTKERTPLWNLRNFWKII